MTHAHSDGQKHVHQAEVDLVGIHVNAIYNGDFVAFNAPKEV